MNIKIIAGSFFASLLLTVNLWSQDTLIHSGAVWEYLYDGTNPGNSWTEENFPGENWKKGASPLGFGYADLATQINIDDATSSEEKPQRHLTSYFKKSIFIEGISKYVTYKINYKRDDGAIIYINNKVVASSNMPEGRIDYLTESNGMVTGSGEDMVLTRYLESFVLNKGTNTIAIEVHQRNIGSSDLIMDFELIAFVDEAELHQLLINDREKMDNDKLVLMSLKHELSQKDIRNDFDNRIIKMQWFIILAGLFFFYRLWLQNVKRQERQEEEKKEIEKKLSIKSQENINLTIASIQSKNTFKEIRLDLMQIASLHKDAKKDLNSIIRNIDAKVKTEADWEGMKVHLDSIYSGFLERLSQQYPTLSQQELRHCAFMKLRLDTKEISKILNIDPKSVQSARYRIKKKMELGEGLDLREVINEF